MRLMVTLRTTARLVQVDISVVTRLSRKAGQQGKLLHDERVREMEVGVWKPTNAMGSVKAFVKG